MAPPGYDMQRVRDVDALVCRNTRPITCRATVERDHRFDEVLGSLSYTTEFIHPTGAITIEDFDTTVTDVETGNEITISFGDEVNCVQGADGRITCRKRTPKYV